MYSIRILLSLHSLDRFFMLNTNNDFHEVIKELRKNARISNLISITMTYVMVFILICSVVGTIAFQKQESSSNPINDLFESMMGKNIKDKEDEKINEYDSKNKIESQSFRDGRELQNMILALKTANAFVPLNNNASVANGVSNSIAKVVLTLTLAFFAIYSVKISIVFIKYYSQLSSHYSALAAAFIASNGDFDKAVKLVKVLSTAHISMGKAPDTIHENALKNLTKALAQLNRKD